MNDDSSIDFISFEKLLREQEAAGNALTVLGSTGEALNINADERREILQFVSSLKLKVPIMVGVGGFNLAEQLSWIKRLNEFEFEAYLLVVPLYAKPGIYGQYGWFKALLDAAAKPCMLYNVPGRTAKILEYETVEMLKNHRNFWAIKEASGSEEEFAKYAAAAPQARMMSGDDPMLPAFSKLGAKGVVSVAANIWPTATNKYTSQCVDGVFIDHELWDAATKALFTASNPIPVKTLLHKLGRIASPQLRLPLSAKDMPSLDTLMELNDKIIKWEQAAV